MTTLEIVGLIFGLVAAAGGLIARDRAVHRSIAAGDRALQKDLSTEIEKLHSRINDVRKEYVPKDDFKQYADRMERLIERVEAVVAGTNKRIDDYFLKQDK